MPQSRGDEMITILAVGLGPCKHSGDFYGKRTQSGVYAIIKNRNSEKIMCFKILKDIICYHEPQDFLEDMVLQVARDEGADELSVFESVFTEVSHKNAFTIESLRQERERIRQEQEISRIIVPTVDIEGSFHAATYLEPVWQNEEDFKYIYHKEASEEVINHCWNCKNSVIKSDTKCKDCKWRCCYQCGACGCRYSTKYK